jgi:hypothetical protein
MPRRLLGVLDTAYCLNAAGRCSGQVGQALKSLKRFVQNLSTRYGIHFLQSVIRPLMTVSSMEVPNGFIGSATLGSHVLAMREERHEWPEPTADHARGLGTGRPHPFD